MKDKIKNAIIALLIIIIALMVLMCYDFFKRTNFITVKHFEKEAGFYYCEEISPKLKMNKDCFIIINDKKVIKLMAEK